MKTQREALTRSPRSVGWTEVRASCERRALSEIIVADTERWQAKNQPRMVLQFVDFSADVVKNLRLHRANGVAKVPCTVRHIPVSTPYIGRRDVGSSFHLAAGHEGIESTNQPSFVPLAWGGARDGEGVSQYGSFRSIEEGRA